MSLLADGLAPPPPSVPEDLARANVALDLWSILVDRVTASVTAEFEARGIESILLKGPAFARLLYDDTTERPYTDTDLLIQVGDRERAEQALGDCGFVRVDYDEDWVGPAPMYAHTFQRHHDNAIIDLHWRLSGADASPELVWSTFEAHRRRLDVAGSTVTVVDPAASALLIALHNAHHGTGRPRTLTDLDQAVMKLDLPVWAEAADIAVRLGATEEFAAGLRVTYAGEALADWLGLGHPASVDMWLKTNPSSYGAWMLERVSQTPDLAGRIRIVMQIIVPPRIQMYRFVPLARRGFPGLLLAYALRPVQLLVHSGPAIRDWTRAWRDTRPARQSHSV
jgi:hypothetical protein